MENFKKNFQKGTNHQMSQTTSIFFFFFFLVRRCSHSRSSDLLLGVFIFEKQSSTSYMRHINPPSVKITNDSRCICWNDVLLHFGVGVESDGTFSRRYSFNFLSNVNFTCACNHNTSYESDAILSFHGNNEGVNIIIFACWLRRE